MGCHQLHGPPDPEWEVGNEGDLSTEKHLEILGNDHGNMKGGVHNQLTKGRVREGQMERGHVGVSQIST